jgi:ribonuclease HI
LDNGRGTSEFEFGNDDFCTRPFAVEFNAPYFDVLSATSDNVDDASVTTAIRSGVASSKTNEATTVEGDELETLLAQIDSGAVSFCTDRQQMLHLCRKISPEYDCTVTLLPASGSSDKLVAACRCVTVQATYAHQEGEYAHLRLVLRTVPMNMHQLLYQEYIRLIRYVLLKNVAKYLRCTKEWGLIYQKTILDPSMPIAEHPSLVLSDNLPAFPMLSSPIEFPCYIDAVHGNDLCCRHSTAGYAVGRRSTAGYGFVLCGATVSYRTKTQFITATCATEAEFLAAVLAANHAKYLRAITNPIQLTCYVDAAHGNEQTRRRSTTGYAFVLGGAAVSYRTKMHSFTGTSSTEAEFLAAVIAAKHGKYLRATLKELGFPQDGPTPICEDNMSAIQMINAKAPTERSRHIDIQFFAIQDWKEAQEFVMRHFPCIINPSDDLTKPLGWVLHARHARRMMGHYG